MDAMQVLRLLAANIRFRANDRHQEYLEEHDPERSLQLRAERNALETVASELEDLLGIGRPL